MFNATGDAYRIIADHLGSVRMVVNATTGEVVQRIDYDEFGNIIRFDATPGFQQPFGFAGGIFDADTGLLKFGARNYDPRIGRWTSKEPLLFDAGQVNFYIYADNDPVNKYDLNGLNPIAAAVVAGCGLLELIDYKFAGAEIEQLTQRRNHLTDLIHRAQKGFPEFQRELQKRRDRRKLRDFLDTISGSCKDDFFKDDVEVDPEEQMEKDYLKFIQDLQFKKQRVELQISLTLAGLVHDGKSIVCTPAGLL
jgi:RHS repeat-associated protein